MAAAIATGESQKGSASRSQASRGEWRMSAIKSGIANANVARTPAANR